MSTRTWKNNLLFIFAAIGGAAGLGNLWRFPYQVYENGGAAYIFAYLVCLFVLVIPLMMTEVALGQTEKKEFITLLGAKAGMIGRFAGWLIVLSLILLLGYYTAITGWSVDYIWYSFTLPWAENAQNFFFTEVLHLTESPSIWGGFSVPVIIGLLISYGVALFAIYKNIDSISRIIVWTVSLPFILLAILLINAITLPGSGAGFWFLLSPDWSQLSNVLLWKNAASQAFFSANIGVAITLMYAKFNKSSVNIVRSTLAIALGNALVSFIAAFAIFGTLGYVAQNQGLSITEVVASGPTLAFIAFPAAIAALPGLNAFMALVFFITLFSLAIDSVFAIAEVIVDAVKTRWAHLKWSHAQWSTVVIVLLFFWSLAFAGGNGLYRLDALDHALWSHTLYWGVAIEIIIFGWLGPIEAIRQAINKTSPLKIGTWFNGLIKYIAPIAVLALYISSLPSEFGEPYGGYSSEFLWKWMYLPMILVVVASAILAWSWNKKSA